MQEEKLTNSDRLKQTGVVDVENPVAAAAQSGRIQELSDSSDDDD
jgi:hypothetical protein